MFKVVIAISLLLSIMISSPINCGTGMRSLEENPFAKLVPTECKDRKLCYFSCRDLFSNDACPSDEFGFEVKDDNIYQKGCQRRYASQDPLLRYLRNLQYQGMNLYHSGDKLLKGAFNVLKKYLDEIRGYDWCREQGTQAYQQRQDAFLKQSTMMKNKQKKKMELITKDDKMNQFYIEQKSYLLQAYRNEQLSDQRCNCITVARYSQRIGKDLESPFSQFASMCSKLPGCYKKKWV